jgi:predicted GIY-YIG superfamily endonuclease
MPWVYVLKGSSGRHYFGSTTELERRLEQHRNGHTHSTRRLGEELKLVASLELSTLEEARELERELKRKKNPRLALFLLEQKRRQLSG